MREDTKKLLQDIRHELVTLDNLIATDREEYFVRDITFRISTADTIKRIDEKLKGWIYAQRNNNKFNRLVKGGK